MRYFVSSLLCAAVLGGGFGYAQTPPAPASVPGEPLRLIGRVGTSTANDGALLDLIAQKGALQKDEFETTAEFNQRLAKVYNPNQVYYFVVTGVNNTRQAQYIYDADTSALTAFAGDSKAAQRGSKFDFQSGIPVRVLMLTDASATTNKADTPKDSATQNDYVLNLRNADSFPNELFDKATGRFAVPITAKPADARVLSKQMYVLIGVTFPDAKRGLREPAPDSASSTATTTEPRYRVTLDAVVQHVLLCDSAADPVLAEYIASSDEPDATQTPAHMLARGEFVLPDALLKKKMHVVMRYRVTIEADGTHSEELLQGSGDKAMDEAVLSWLHGWRWDPAKQDGKPVRSAVTRKMNIDQN